MATVRMGWLGTLTTDHPEASKEKPVMVVGDDFYRPNEFVGPMAVYHWVYAWSLRNDLTKDEQGLAEAFLANVRRPRIGCR